MDPSRYYAQSGPSSQYPQHQYQDNDRGNQMQVSPVDNQTVQQYITHLYRNPMSTNSGPTNDPAFYAKAHEDLFNAKHRIEQMLLLNQQHAERAQMATQIQHPLSIHPPHVAYVNAQVHAPHQHGAWAGLASGPWTYQPHPAHQQQAYPQQPYHQQAYAQPMPQVYPGQFVPDVTMHHATFQQAQSIPQVVQLDSPQQNPVPYHQPQSTHENPPSTQQDTVPLPNVRVQSQSAQAAPSTSTSHAQNMHQPQPQPEQSIHSHGQQSAFVQGNPLQPGHQPNQAGSSTTQKVRETTQKQLHYLQLLAQQHQRKQQSRPSSHQSSPASSQVALPSVPPITNVNGTGNIPSHPVSQLAPTQRSSSPPQELPGSTTQVGNVDTVNPSPAKIRSRKPFALHDLRPERRRSLAPSNASNTPSREMNPPASEGVNAPSSEATPSKGAKPADNAPHGSSPAEAGPSPNPSAQTTNGLMPSHGLSNTPSPLAQPAQIAVEPAPIPVDTTSLASEIPNAPAPALNKPTESVPAPSSSTNAPKQSSAGSSKMKIALENLHIRGADCVALVRQAAQIAGVSVDNLPEETGPVDTSVPLFTPGQPLHVWTSNLQVTRQQGDAVVRGIWDLMKKKAREIGIDAEVLRHPPPEVTTDGAPAGNDPVANYGNSIPSVSGAEISSNSNDSAEPGASQSVTAVQQPHITPGAAKLSTESRPPSTQPPMQTVTVPLSQASPASIPAHPASTPVPPAPTPVPPAPTPAPPPQVARPAPVHQTSNVPSPTQPDPAAVQAQLAQRHQYNPYPNGAPPQSVYQVPEQQQQHSRAHAPAYVPPNLATQTQAPVQAPRSQAPVQVSQPQPQSERTKMKPRKTAALDYLLALGVDISGEGAPRSSESVPSKPVTTESELIQTKDKGKGKAVDVEEPAAPVQPEPSNNGNVASEPVPPVDVAGPSQVLEVPPSPIAPTIAVLPEPSPTPPSPLSIAEAITRPVTPVAHSPVAVHAASPLQVSTSTVDSLDMSVDTVPPSVPAPESASATMQASAPTLAPVEPPSSIPAISVVNSDPAPPVASQDTMLSPPIASISALTLNSQSSPAESTLLKRKRESRPSDVIEAGPGPNTQERARQQHAAGNKHEQKRPKVAKRDSTTTSVVQKSTSSHLENPYPNIPRPDSPLPKNSWAQSYATAMNSANRTERPLFRPETPPSDMASSPLKPKLKSGPVKQRMIMEVVIPLRKKGKVAADLTLSDAGTERDEDLGLDELVYDIHDDTRTEQEPDLKMLRRRLRPHTCEWEGCIGPPVLSSVELLGVHLNKYHLNCRDPDTGYYMCRWDNCMLHFKNPRRLWSHISEKHVRHPLYCPYQDCDRTTSERYRMVVHVNRAHRGNADAKLRVFAQPEDFPPDRADPEEGVLLRPDAFPEGVPYFRTMGMALRYEVVPAQIPSQRHARIGPIILRNISAPTGLVSVPRQAAGSRAPELPLPPVLLSPMPLRSQVRLGTVPPDALGEELEREAGPPPNKSPVRRITTAKGKVAESNGKAKANPSPARSHITITSDESSPEPPAYVSARSADEILSSIRPTRIKSESLRSLNIFLDELLWLILHSARSLATNRLKAGLLQIMPSAVGKDAVLEAEVELRAYRQRSPSLDPEEQGVKQADFPLQPTFELLRQKCEAYCTLGDLEENVAAESALQEKMLSAGPSAFKVEQVVPAALYLTAILEHICEHVLNNVGQVVARDSSRATAYSMDVYTALCEDTAIYPLFKTMKVHEQIETQSRAFRPSHGGSSSISGGSRTRSISRMKPNEDLSSARKMSMPTSSSAMPTPSSPTNASSSPFGRRPSADAVLATSHQAARPPNAPTPSGSSKSSLERTRSSLERITGKKSMERSNSIRDKTSRGIKLFGRGSGRNSSEDGASNHMAPFPSVSVKEATDEQSTSSQSDGTRRGTVFQQGPNPESDAGDESDGPFTQDFDELMRSGATMKVSLTPDRLKTFEVFAKQKNQRSRGQSQDNPSSVPPPPPPAPYSPDSSNMIRSPRTSSARREVDAIMEADETVAPSRTQSVAPQFLSEEPPLPAAPVPAVPAAAGRSRSHTESGTARPSIGTKPSNAPGLLRKASFNGSLRTRSGSDTTPPNEPSARARKVSEAPKLATMATTPVRKRGPARRRESMDLDDIINEPVTPRRGGANTLLVAKPAHQTANTRDLIDFLSEGPPEPSLHIARSASQGTLDLIGSTSKTKQSGGGRWFKRFVGGGSTSGERSLLVPDVPEPASATRILGKQRSEKNLRGTSTSGLASYGKVPPSPALSVDTGLHPHPSLNLGRRVSPNRKAVPAWNEGDTPRAVDYGQIQIQTTLSPQRDAFMVSGQQPEAGRSLSPASSKPSLRRVPVPKLDDDTSSRADVSEHGLQLVPEPISVPKSPELGLSKPERRRPEKIQDSSLASAKVQDKSREAARPASPVGNITPGQAAELRAAIAHATSADECRMLLDLVLGQWGLGRHDPEPTAVPPLSAGCSDYDDTDEAMAVDMLLGEGTLKPERQWPLTPKDSHPKLFEARVAASLRSSE
ncbi:unnamed protein product [Rhizoctonia solani]|uniref:C2H2-type domain-containing protein n=1 Tax=Rhizoctonia solani TaxID=456999 RepID=A0A8H3DEM2_9AGAM|nr:unnamed protein product [Rhizoctonia solani]